MSSTPGDVLKQIDERELHELLISSIPSMPPATRRRVLDSLAHAAANSVVASVDEERRAKAADAPGSRRKRPQSASASPGPVDMKAVGS